MKKNNIKNKIINPMLIVFAMGVIGFISENSYAGSNNYAMPTWISRNNIPGNWVITNTEPEIAYSIRGDNHISFGRWSGNNISGNNNFIAGQNGAGRNTSGNSNIIMGQEAGVDTTGNSNIALGDRAGKEVSGNNNFSGGPFGSGNRVTGNNNIALGNQSGIAVGYKGNDPELLDKMGNYNVGIGRLAGNDVQGSENYSIGARVGSNVNSTGNVAIGVESGNNVQGNDNISLGGNNGNNVSGSNNFLSGGGSGHNIKGSNNIVLGHDAGNINQLTANDTVSIGRSTKAEKDNVTTLGYGAKAKEDKTLALGNSTADVINSVSIGDGSKTNSSISNRTKGNDNSYTTDTIDDKSYTFAGGDQVIGVVSIGNENETRRIQNVAPGLISKNSTDAINGSQLYSLAEKVANYNSTGGVGDNTVKIGGDNKTLTNSQKLSKTGGIKFDIVKSENNSYIVTKASNNRVEIDLTEEAKDKIEKNTYFHVNTGDADQEEGDSVTNYGSSSSKAGELANHSLTAGIEVVSNSENGVAIGRDITSFGRETIAIGDQVIVKKDTVSSIGIGKQAVIDGKESIAIGVISNSQKDYGISLGNYSRANEVRTIAIGNVSRSEYEGTVTLGKYSISYSEGSTNIGAFTISTINKSISLGAESMAVEAVSVNEAIIGSLTYGGFAGNTPYSSFAIGSIQNTRQMQNVAAGQINKESTDAINGSQLYATNNALGNLTNATKTFLGGNSIFEKDGDNIAKFNMDNIGETDKDNINDAIATSITEVRVVNGSLLDIEKSIANDGHPIYTLDFNTKTRENIKKLENSGQNINAGVASAVAMANLPQVSNIAGHRHNIAGAYGYYNGEHAFALGLSGLNETGNLVYKASGSLNTKGHVALGAGLGYQFDKLESRRKDMLTLQRNGNINLLDEKVYQQNIRLTNLRNSSLALLDKLNFLENKIEKLMK
ncbi:YadA-like family protein [Streptobacillus felis]|uniref:YadA-like family protein n=1 Tax=Streptobacillus felis TaxID=1384509 RepID=A0A7Z0TCJ3_9FUSO|nr:YadA-like family protein [Streptobacillus felis]NYV28373.1 YadA-like family protein [Streptobacillus felis]